jgi:pyruvate formate lyase activating enzyme
VSKQQITPQEVIDLFHKNQSYYQHGGITLSGGEPLIHQAFCLTLAQLCKKQKISLTFDTSGATFNTTNLSFYKKLITYHPL